MGDLRTKYDPRTRSAQVTISSTIEVVPALPPLSSRVLGSKSFFASPLYRGTWIASLSSSTLSLTQPPDRCDFVPNREEHPLVQILGLRPSDPEKALRVARTALKRAPAAPASVHASSVILACSL
ncbi:hypothetical protein ACFXTH_034786 [Malus domestica]